MKDLKGLSTGGMNINKKIETKNLDDNNTTRFPLDASFQGVNRLLKTLITLLKMLLVIQLTILLIEFKKTVTENISSRE